MATFTTASGRKLVKGFTSGADTYVVTSDSKGLTLTGNNTGDTIQIDGLSTDFTFRASGKTLTLTSIDDPSFRIQVQIANGGSVTLGFLDGGVTASYAATGSAKGVTIAGSTGSQKLTTKSVALADAVVVNEATGSTATFDADSGSATGDGVNVPLTADVGETVTGTAFNDVFGGVTNATLHTGDQINAGSGTDTLNVLANGSGITSFLNSVETINVRMIADTTLDATLWSGTTSINVTNDSIDDRTLTVSSVAATTTLGIADKVIINATLLDGTGTADALKLSVNSAGSASVNTLGAESFNISNSGTSILTLEGSASLATITASGQGNLTIGTNDSVSAINVSGFSGITTTTVSSTSNLAFTGGSGADALVISTQTLTSADTLNGGAGVDTLNVSLDGAELKNVSNFEVGVFAVSAAVNASFSGFNTLTFSGSTDAAVNASGIAGGAVVNLGNNSASTVTFGYNSGGAADINLTGDTATVALATTRVSGASTVSFDVVGSAAAYTVSSLRLESGDSGGGADSVRVSVDSSGSLTITELRARDAETVSLLATGASSLFSIGSDLQASGATTIALLAEGTGSEINIADSITVTGIATTLGIVTSGSGASIDVDGFSADQNANLSINLTVGTGGKFGSAADFDVAIATSGTLTLTGNVGQSAGASLATVDAGNSGVATVGFTLGVAATGTVGNITAQRVNLVTITGASESSATFGTITGAGASGSVASISLNQAGSGTVTLGAVTAPVIGAVTLSGGADANVSAGNLTAVSGISSLTITGGASSVLSVGDVAAASSTIGAIVGTLGASAAATIGDLTASGAVAGITFTLGAGADLTIGSGAITGASAQDAFGNISISGGSEVDVAIAGISARQGIGNISVAIGSSASYQQTSAINSVSASIGNISFAVGGAGVASAAFAAGANIGNITLTGSGTVDIDSLTASGIGNITVSQGVKLAAGTVSALTVGDISLGGNQSATLTLDAELVGDITVTGSGATITVVSGNIDSVRLANVGGTVSVDFGDASSINGITVTGNSSNVSLDLTSVDLFTEISLGTGVNVVTIGQAGDQLTLAAGTGVDTIRFGGSAFNSGGIRNFQFGSALDSLAFAAAGFNLGLGSADPADNPAGEDLNVVNISSAGIGVTFASAATVTAATDVLIITKTGFASAGAMLASLASAGSLGISAVGGGGAVSAGQEILVVWYNVDESRTELSIVNSTAVASANNFFGALDAGDVSLLATFSGDIRTFGSGETFAGNFEAY